MQIKDGDVQVILPKDNYPEHTQAYVKMLIKMIAKGLENPAVQLHNLSLITTGKPFKLLVSKNVEEDGSFLEILRGFTDQLLKNLQSSIHSNMSNSTIEDFLNGTK